MFINPQNNKITLRVILYVCLCVWTLIVLAGCGGGDFPVASVLTSGRITLSWNAVPGAASYDIYMATSPGVTTLNSYKISDVTAPITITDLEPGTTYYFIVAVYSDTGESRKSKEVSSTIADTEGIIEFGDLIGQSEPEDKSLQPAETPASSSAGKQSATKKAASVIPTADQTSPSASKKSVPAPTKKSATEAKKSAPVATKQSSQADQSSAPGTREVTLAWDNVSNASSYNIYWNDKPGVTRRNGTKIGNAKNPHKLKGLIKGKKYYFVVTAVNQSRESSESAEFSFTVGE